jgi:hypothetical protein
VQTPHPDARHSASLRAFTPVFDGLWTRVNALKARVHPLPLRSRGDVRVIEISIRARVLIFATRAAHGAALAKARMSRAIKPQLQR